MSDGVLIYPKNVQLYFPHDTHLRDFGAQAYAGVPLLLSTSGCKFGLFGLVFKQPLDSVHCSFAKYFSSGPVLTWFRSILFLTSHKIAYELEKMQLLKASQAKDGLIKKLGERIRNTIVSFAV